MNLSSVCLCGRHHPCRYDYGDEHSLGSYFRDDPDTPIYIADDNEAHKAELVLSLPYEEQDNGNRDELERALATYRGSGMMARKCILCENVVKTSDGRWIDSAVKWDEQGKRSLICLSCADLVRRLHYDAVMCGQYVGRSPEAVTNG